MQELSLQTLHEMEGLAEAFAAELRRATLDCLDRPGTRKPRTITIKVEVVPDKNDPLDVVVAATVGSKAPARPLDPYRMHGNSRGQLKFSPASPGNPDQQTMDFD